MKQKKDNEIITMEDYKQLVINYERQNTKFKQIQTQFTEMKDNFNSLSAEYFEQNQIGSEGFTFELDEENTNESESKLFVVKKVQKSTVLFNANKLEKVLDSEIRNDVITTKYEVMDMTNLVRYLRTKGVDPKIFKSFIQVTKSVNSKELERLESIGLLNQEQLDGCYEIRQQKPYFTAKQKQKKKDKGDED